MPHEVGALVGTHMHNGLSGDENALVTDPHESEQKPLLISTAHDISDRLWDVSNTLAGRIVLSYGQTSMGCIVQVAYWPQRREDKGPRHLYRLYNEDPAKLTTGLLENDSLQEFARQAGIEPAQLVEEILTWQPD